MHLVLIQTLNSLNPKPLVNWSLLEPKGQTESNASVGCLQASVTTGTKRGTQQPSLVPSSRQKLCQLLQTFLLDVKAI